MSERGSKLMTRSSFVEKIAVGEAAVVYLEALIAQGVDCLFLNPGTDTFPVQEAAVNLRTLGRPRPRILLCPFETEVLMASPGEVQVYHPDKMASGKLGAGDPDELREVARALVQAERPLVITGFTGRSKAGYDGLLKLAELLALPVLEWRDRVSFPADHPVHQGYGLASGPLVASADPRPA